MWSHLLTLTHLAVGRSTDAKQCVCGRRVLQSKIACAEKLTCYAMLLAWYAMLLACTLLILDWHVFWFAYQLEKCSVQSLSAILTPFKAASNI